MTEQIDVMGILRDYMVRARPAGKTSYRPPVTQAEMEVLMSEADTDEKREYLEKNFIVIEPMDENWEFRQKMLGRYDPKPQPRNRADRRLAKFGRTK